MPKFLFFDIDKKLITEYHKTFKAYSDIECVVGDIRELISQRPIHVLVSPANSYGDMSGGIDLVYHRMFKMIEQQVQCAIKGLGYKDPIANLPICPVGSALLVKMDPQKNSKCEWMLCAPTMKHPSDISKRPENIYYAMVAILDLVKNLPEDIVVGIPGLGTGCGNVSPEESALQIKQAFLDVLINKNIKYPKNTIIKRNTIKDEIPHYYVIQMFLY